MTVTIRRATLEDAPALGVIHSFCWGDVYPKTLKPEVLAQLNPGFMQNLWEKFVTRGGRYEQWVAVSNGQIVGFVGTGPGRDADRSHQTELYFFYVVPSARRSGVGTRLLQTADADYLWIAESLKDTRRFYRRHDFEPEIVRGTRGKGPNGRAAQMFGAYFTELRMVRESAA